jgi:hypothetical protein
MLTDADRATLQARLAEAETALHRLRTGAMVAEVRTETETVKYSAANLPGLVAYVADLKRRLGLLPRGGAIRVGF